MTVVFVAPDDSDDEDLSNCEPDTHLKYKFITDETEHNPRIKTQQSSASDIESMRRVQDLSASNGSERERHALDHAETASVDSNHR